MLEIHPFGAFLPDNTRILVVGTFPGRQYTQRTAAENEADETAFSYGGRNQFWRIMERLYDVELPTRAAKKALFATLGVGLIDTIKACRRRKPSNLDTDLIDIEWNKAEFDVVFARFSVEKILCTGEGVAKIMRKWFPDAPVIALPSPSPRYAQMRFEEKLAFYKTVFPEGKF